MLRRLFALRTVTTSYNPSHSLGVVSLNDTHVVQSISQCNHACTVKILYGFYSTLSIQKHETPWFWRVGTGVKFNNHTPI